MLKPLPEPDWLDTALPDSPVCLLTDDRSPVAINLANALSHKGWKVVVLSFPESFIARRSSLPQTINRVVLHDLSEAHLKQQLNKITTLHGKIGGFIHLNPVLPLSHSEGIVYHSAERAITKLVFLIAKYLKPSLTKAAHTGRSCFLTVARLDGRFGLSHEVNFGPIAAGFFGLTKTVNFEWSSVFCRALDLSPDISPDHAAQLILAEMHDPNLSITEVGYSTKGRSTLVCEQL